MALQNNAADYTKKFKVRVERRSGDVVSYFFDTVDEANTEADAWDAGGHVAVVSKKGH